MTQNKHETKATVRGLFTRLLSKCSEKNGGGSPPDKLPNEYQVVTVVPVELYTEGNLEECRKAILGQDEDGKEVVCECISAQKKCCKAPFHKNDKYEKIKGKINNSAKLQFEIREIDVDKIDFSDVIEKNLIEIGKPDAFIAISDNSKEDRQGAEISYINTSIVLILKLDIKFTKLNEKKCVQMLDQYGKISPEQYGEILTLHGEILKKIGDKLMKKNGDKDRNKSKNIAFYKRDNKYKVTDYFSDIFEIINNVKGFKNESKDAKNKNENAGDEDENAERKYSHLHELIDVNFAFTYFNVIDAEFTINGKDNKERQESFVEHFADKSDLISYAALLFELMPETSLPEDPKFIPQINGGGMNDYCSIIVRYPNRMCCFIKKGENDEKDDIDPEDDIGPEDRILALTIAMFSFWNRLYSFSDALRKLTMNGGLNLSRETPKLSKKEQMTRKERRAKKKEQRSPYENFLNEIHKTPINIEQLLETAGYDHDAITLQRLAEASKFKSTGEIFKDDKQSYLAFHEGEMNRDHDKGRHRVNVRLQIFVVFFAIATLLVTDNFIENIGINIQDSDVWIITAAIIIIASLHIFDLIKKDWWLWCKYILSIIVAIVAVVFVIFTDYYKPESTSNSVDSTPSILVNSDDTPAN